MQKPLMIPSAKSSFDAWDASMPVEFRPGRERLAYKMSAELAETYGRCSGGEFQWRQEAAPRRCLTKGGPEGNARQDMVLWVGDVLRGGNTASQYVVLDMLGSGTFGQVVRARREGPQGEAQVAVKVVRNKPAYTKQGLIEIGIVEHLNRADAYDRHHVVRMHDYFVCQGHVCLVFELLSVNLYELLKSNGYRGLSCTLVRVLVSQLLDACALMRRLGLLHCDLKPENILLVSAAHPVIKVIDFGSACYENHTSFTYVQSRFYRSPEVLLGCGYSMDIDMWSVGCIVAELYLGLPLFPGSSELTQLRLIEECCGAMPEHMLLEGVKTTKYYHRRDGLTHQLKSEDEYYRELNIPPKRRNRRYFTFSSLQELTARYPAGAAPDTDTRQALASLLQGLLQLNPLERWTPQQASHHPFLTGEPWLGHWAPEPRQLGAVLDRSSGRRLRSSSHGGLGRTDNVPLGSSPGGRPLLFPPSDDEDPLDDDDDDDVFDLSTPPPGAVPIPGARPRRNTATLQPTLGNTPSDSNFPIRRRP